MQTLNSYILEKFKITKNISSQDEYQKGDYLLRVFLSSVKYHNTDKSDLLHSIEIGLSNDGLAIFSRLEDDRFYFINHKGNNKEDTYDYETKHEINSNGYLEFDNVTNPMYSFKSLSVYLKKDDALKFLEQVSKNVTNIKKYIFDYFDRKYEKYCDLSNLYINESHDAIEKMIGYLNEKA